MLRREARLMYVLKAIGKAKAVFAWISILATTVPIETDLDWWAVRLWLVRN